MRVLVITTIILAIFLAGCACEELGIKAPPTTHSLIDDCNQDDHCLKKKALKNANAEVCEEIYRAGPKSKCFLQLAEDNLDVTMCYRMEGGAGAYSKEECYYHVALAKNDPNICNNIPDSYEGRSTDLTKGGFDYDQCWKKAERGSVLTEECGDQFLPCCGEGVCKENMYCDPSFRCNYCGDVEQACCPPSYRQVGYKWCKGDMPCIEDVCKACGAEGQPCCNHKDDPCNRGLECEGTCEKI